MNTNPRMLQVIPVAALAMLVFAGTAKAQEQVAEEESSPNFACQINDPSFCMTIDEYKKAGIVGTIVGFGSGHLMTGETKRGVGFLVGEGLFVVVIGVGVALFVDLIPTGDAMTADFIGGIMYIGGGIGLGALRIWEKVDVWKRPRHRRISVESGLSRGEVGVRTVALTPILAPAFGGDRIDGAVLGFGGRF